MFSENIAFLDLKIGNLISVIFLSEKDFYQKIFLNIFPGLVDARGGEFFCWVRSFFSFWSSLKGPLKTHFHP